MSVYPVQDVMAALIAVLAGDATLVALATGGIHNDAPDDVEYPHLVVSFVAPRPWHTLGGAAKGLGWQFLIDVHVFSQHAGEIETLAIAERVVELLNFQSLTVTGFATAFCEHRTGSSNAFAPRMKVEANKDKLETRHYPVEFLVTVHQQ